MDSAPGLGSLGRALELARSERDRVLIVDTAGRLQIDEGRHQLAPGLDHLAHLLGAAVFIAFATLSVVKVLRLWTHCE